MYTEFNSNKIYEEKKEEQYEEKPHHILSFIWKILLIFVIIIILFLILIKFEVISLTSSVAPNAVLLNQNEIGIKVGNSYQLESTVLPNNAKNKQVIWESSNPNIVYVNEVTGFIEALKEGTAVITVKTLINEIINECIVHVTNQDILVSEIKINQEHTNVAVGYTSSISYKIFPGNANILGLNFTSSDPSIATVTDNGIIKGIKEGTAVITVNTNNLKTDNIYVTVYKKGNQNILDGEIIKTENYPKNINLNDTNINLKIGGTSQLIANIYPSNSNNIVSWYSSNSNVASVSKNGIVTAKNLGTATIVATTINGLTATCQVTVGNYSLNLRKIQIVDEDTMLDVNDTKQLMVSFTPSNASDKTITWSSSDSSIIEVSESGLVKAKKKGTAIITATAKDGNHQDTITFEVLNTNSSQTEKSLSFSNSTYTVSIGSTLTLNPIITPSNASFRGITFQSHDESVAKVDSNGVVTGISEGETLITAITNQNNLKATITIHVKNIKPTGVILNKTNITIKKNATYTLISKITPSNASYKNVTYQSEDRNIAKVDSNGIITGINTGTTTITVTPIAGGNPSTCLVTVK